ncbi:MAG: hypothetical protein ACE5KF_03265, partial [Kiloniellaceae bacterium]
RQPSPNVGKGLVPKGSFDAATGSCKYNPASEADSGDWKKPRKAGSGEPAYYRGPGKHKMVDLDLDGVPDPYLPDYPRMGLVESTDLPGVYIRAMAYPKDTCNYTLSDTDDPSFTAANGVSIRHGPGGCLFKVPPGDKTPEGRQMGTGQWDIQTYLDVYHPGMTEADLLDPTGPNYADRPNSPTIGPDGRISRWELYVWEKEYDPATGSYPNMAFEEPPVCYRGGAELTVDYDLPEPPAVAATVDRRIMIMAVVNCAAMGGGRRTVDRTKPHGNVAVFLTEPMGYTVADTLFGELVDPLGLGIGDVDVTPDLVKERFLLIK